MKKKILITIILTVIATSFTTWFVIRFLTPTYFCSKDMATTPPPGAYLSALKYLDSYKKTIGNFDLETVFIDDQYAKFIIIPEDKNQDEAQLYLKNDNGHWIIIAGPGTAFPDLEERYPELKGK